MNRSEHFSLEKMTFSETAASVGIDNAAGPEVVANLKSVAELMERVRA